MLNGCRRVAAAVVGLVTAAVLVTGCSGDGDPDAAASPSPEATAPSPTPTATTTAPPAPAIPEVVAPSVPAFDKGAEGREDFARYVVQSWAYALTANDAAPLLDVSAGSKPCAGCKELRATLEQREEEGWAVYPFEPRIDRIKVGPGSDVVTATVRFDLPETDSLFTDGRPRNTNAAREDLEFSVTMRVEKRAYRLVAFTIT